MYDNKTFLMLSFVIPSLLLIPIIIGEEASAYPLENYELRFSTTFTHNDINDIQPMVDYLEDETILHNMFYESFAEIAVGQFAPEDIEADWNLKYSQGVWTINIDPKILYINIKSGVNHADVQDQALDDGRNQVGAMLNTFGINTYTQTVYYEGGSQTFEVTP